MDAEEKRRAYVKQLESVVKQMLTPLKGVPFNLAIEAMTGKQVLAFDIKKGSHRKVLDEITKAAEIAGKEINRHGIQSQRVNEVGNKIEPFVREALQFIGIQAEIPHTRSGKKKATGYPDIFASIAGVACYIECKTYNADNIATTQRSFYFSPSSEFKVTEEAIHFLLSYEMEVKKGKYFARGFKLLSIESLSLDVKHEFNSDNKRMYSGKDGTRLLHEHHFA